MNVNLPNLKKILKFWPDGEINRLAIPAILTGIGEPLISLVDTAFLGQLGTTELAAAGIASSFYLMTVWILTQTLTAISAIISRFYGSGKLEAVKSLVPQALYANVLLGLICLAITYSFSTEIFEFYQARGEVLSASTAYFRIRAFGFPFTLATLLLFGVFRGLQDTFLAMVIALSGALVNVVLDYILIFKWGGTGLGLEGAALASLAAQVFMFVLAVVILLRRTPFGLRFSLPLNGQFKWLASMSGDLFIRTIMLNLTFYLAIRFATSYGESAVAAHTIALNIWLFSSFFIDGYAHAGNAIAGKQMGQGKLASIATLGSTIVRISMWIGIALAAIYALGYFYWGHLFSKDPVVVQLFENVFWLVIISQPINAIAFSLDGMYKGMGRTKVLRNLLIASTIFAFVPVALFFHFWKPSLSGIWLAFLLWMCARGGWLLWDFRRTYPKENMGQIQDGAR